MGTVKLCVHEPVKIPYYVEATGVHLYSVEELAYYLYENLYLIDEGMIDDRLFFWIDTALGLSKLAEKLYKGRTAGTHVYNQVMTILQASQYYSESELSLLSERIQSISGMQTQERMKNKADELAQNGKLWAAISEYERILGIRQNSRLSVEFYANVWNNLASCYAKVFLFEKAASCYENAYQFHKQPEYKERAYYARKLACCGITENDEVQETKISEEFLEKSAVILKSLEERSKAECEKYFLEK